MPVSVDKFIAYNGSARILPFGDDDYGTGKATPHGRLASQYVQRMDGLTRDVENSLGADPDPDDR